MSEGYTFDHVIQDCVGDRAGGMPGDSFARRTLFVESWNALNSWIESRMRKEKVYIYYWKTINFVNNSFVNRYRVLKLEC